MKRNIGLLLLLLGLAAIYFLMQSNDKGETSSISIEDREFVVSDASLINTITIKSVGYPLIHLSKEKDRWYLNRKYLADSHIVENMTAVLSKMRIKYIPPKTQKEMINKSKDKVGMHIKSFDKEGNVLSDFIMASNTNAEDGTYCIKSGATQAYVMSMPIVEGGLRNYFNHPFNGLRDKAIFRTKPEEIESIEVDYHKDTRHSYKINKEGGTFALTAKSFLANQSGTLSQNLIDAYVNDFDVLFSEYISNDNPAKEQIEGSLPFATIKIQLEEDKLIQIELFPDLDLFDKTVQTQRIEDLNGIDRFFVRTNWEDFYTLQLKQVAKLLKNPSYFYR